MTRLLAVITLMAGAIPTEQPGAKTMFYDPAGAAQPADESHNPRVSRLRPIVFARPFPPRGHVGIHYWFEDQQRTPLSESRAGSATGRFTLHIRNNVGGGFLTVWQVEGDGGLQLTPMEGRYAGFQMSELEYVLPGNFEFAASDAARRLIAVFSRSQTEQAASPAHARQRWDTISKRSGSNGPALLRESDDSTPGEIGTYVVNQYGGPVATEIILRRTLH